MRKYWLKYAKNGLLRFVGHLDILHTWERILRRARLPVSYSQGFSPHPLLSLAAPLPVGQTSEAEYLELVLDQDMDASQVLGLVAAALPPELSALDIEVVPERTKALTGMIRFADYLITLPVDADQQALQQRIEGFQQAESEFIEIERKRGIKQVDIKPLVKDLRLDGNQIYACLATGGEGNLRPGDLLRFLGLSEEQQNSSTVRRMELYLEQEGELIDPLGMCRRNLERG